MVDFQAVARPEANRRSLAIPQRRGVAAIARRAVPTPDKFAAAIDEDEIVSDSVKRHRLVLRGGDANRSAFDCGFAVHWSVAPSLLTLSSRLLDVRTGSKINAAEKFLSPYVR